MFCFLKNIVILVNRKLINKSYVISNSVLGYTYRAFTMMDTLVPLCFDWVRLPINHYIQCWVYHFRGNKIIPCQSKTYKFVFEGFRFWYVFVHICHSVHSFQTKAMGKCFYNSGEKSDLFVETFLIFENAGLFSSILLRLMKKKQGRLQVQNTQNFIPLRVVCYKPFKMTTLLTRADHWPWPIWFALEVVVLYTFFFLPIIVIYKILTFIFIAFYHFTIWF